MEQPAKLASLEVARLLGRQFTYGDGTWCYRYKNGKLQTKLTVRGYLQRRGTIFKWLHWFDVPHQECGVVAMHAEGILRWVKSAD